MKLNSNIAVKVSSGVLFALLLSSTASASVITGSIWENEPLDSAHAQPSFLPTTAPDVTFTTSSTINFASPPSTYTIGSFIGAGTASTVLTGSSQLGNTLNNTFFLFTGTITVTTGETFTISHDDGATFVVGGVTVISSPQIQTTNNSVSTYTGPSGTFSFDLYYGETAGAPADLTITLPTATSATPEPSSVLLMGGGLLVVAGLLKRKIAA